MVLRVEGSIEQAPIALINREGKMVIDDEIKKRPESRAFIIGC